VNGIPPGDATQGEVAPTESPPDAEDWLPKFREAIRRAAAEVFRLRGELLSEAAGIELDLDRAIGFYFEVPPATEPEFRLWVLRQPVSQKIDIFRRIVKARDSTYMANLVSRLEAANTFRNLVAHSSVSVFPVAGSIEISSSMMRKSGSVSVETDPAELERWLLEMEELGALVTVVSDRILSGPKPFNPVDTDWPVHVGSVYRDGVVSVSNKFLDSIPEHVSSEEAV
jgi:hypothetical protein